MPLFANLPTEIESKILEFLADDKEALYSTIRINQAWLERTVDLLWQHFSANDFAMIEEPRRQHYADKVVKLEVTSLICYSRFRFMSFPALVEVTLGADYYKDYRPRLGRVRISPFLQSSLKRLHLIEPFILTEDAMDLICLRCPLLEDLELTSQLAFIHPEMYLLHASFNFPKLRKLVYKWDILTSQQAMKRLAEQLPLLEYLDISQNDLGMWGGVSGPVFPELKTLVLDLLERPLIPDLYVRSMPAYCLQN